MTNCVILVIPYLQCVYFWKCVSLFLGNVCVVAHPPTEKSVEGTDTYLNQGRKVRTVAPANQQRCIGMLCRYECIVGWFWVGKGRDLVIGYHTTAHIIFHSREIICNLFGAYPVLNAPEIE